MGNKSSFPYFYNCMYCTQIMEHLLVRQEGTVVKKLDFPMKQNPMNNNGDFPTPDLVYIKPLG